MPMPEREREIEREKPNDGHVKSSIAPLFSKGAINYAVPKYRVLFAALC